MLTVPHSKGQYRVLLSEDAFADLGSRSTSPQHFFIDASIEKHYPQGVRYLQDCGKVHVIEASEDQKDYQALGEWYGRLMSAGFQRGHTLATVGGGVLQDLSGFIASTLYRGIDWVYAPTTLLAQADSCIGSKTSINFHGTKNMLGTFYPPREVILDPVFCTTLPDAEIASGLSEVIKFHVMTSEDSVDFVSAHLTAAIGRDTVSLQKLAASSLERKKAFIVGDEFDKGRRNLCNYGHCFGHALESASEYRVNHGQAVAVGMVVANSITQMRNQLPLSVEKRLLDLIFPVLPQITLDEPLVEACIGYMKQDKKRRGQLLTAVVCYDIGELSLVHDVTEEEVHTACRLYNEKTGGVPHAP
jgi:3-dehydroquinate synthase